MPENFITSDGATYPLRIAYSDSKISLALAAIEKKFRAAGEPLDPPTYTIETAAGSTETHPLDEAAAKTDEEKEKLAAHQDALARLQSAQVQKKMRLLLRGIVWEEKPEWEEEHKTVLEIDVPPDGEERWFHFLTTEVLKTPADFVNAIEVMTALTYQGGINPDELHAVMNSFRDYLQGRTPEPPKVEKRAVGTRAKAN